MVIKINYKYLLGIVLIIFSSLIFLIIGYSHPSPDADKSNDNGETLYLPIIMYHEIKTYKTGKDVITPYEFESDLKYLQNNNYHTITMTELINYVYGNGKLPENPIVLSFDDGYLSTYKYAFPLLKKYNMKMVFSIIGKNTDDFTRIPDDNLDYSHVTWAQLKEMTDSGYVEVQNHTYNLHKMSNGRIGCMQCHAESAEKYEQLLTDDITKLQNKIFESTGKSPNTFTYPYGKFNNNSELIMKKLGFKATLSCQYGINAIKKDPERLFGLKRICRSHGYNMKKLLKEAQKTIK